MSFISRDAPRLARGFPEAKPPMIMLMEGMARRYTITIKSPINVLAGFRLFTHNKVETRITLARPRAGAARKAAFDVPVIGPDGYAVIEPGVTFGHLQSE